MIEIREERQGDEEAIRRVDQQAFGATLEADIVGALRASGSARLSLVATLDGVVVGHVMYSPVTVGDVTGAGLGPMAVAPAHQRQGIGARLVEAGSRRLAEEGCPFIVVVGHPEYYPRFGFAPARNRGITCEWDVPDDVFMVQVLDQARMAGVSGRASYRPEFREGT